MQTQKEQNSSDKNHPDLSQGGQRGQRESVQSSPADQGGAEWRGDRRGPGIEADCHDAH